MPIIDTWRGPTKPEGVKAFMGWAGLTVLDESINVLDMIRAFIDRAAQESCGQCFPCRNGLKQAGVILNRLCEGQGGENALKKLKELAYLVKNSSRCDIGQTSTQPLIDILENYPELLTPRQSHRDEYVSVVTAPCISACPSHVNIPDYIEKIRTRRFDQALDAVLCDCPMPGTIGRVCFRPCELNCKRGFVDAPLAIKHLKRFLADNDLKTKTSSLLKKKPSGHKVAVVGAGPAGLSCAYYLGKKGFQVTIFESQEKAGGMAKYGIPDYRLPADILQQEVNLICKEGCEIKYGIEIGRDITIQQLWEEHGYEAVFVGTGAPKASKMHCKGEDAGYEGVLSGIEFLAKATRGQKTITGDKVLVIGGGNVAMDCIRTALRVGFKDVQLIYRRTLAQMPADIQEIEEAQEEGVTFNYLMAPLEIVAENNKVKSLICQKMALGEPDASGRRKPEPVPGSEIEIPCDAIISAIGQVASVDLVLEGTQVSPSKWNTIVANEITGQSPHNDSLFGGGDCLTGPDTLISALAAGKRAANYIDIHLNGESTEPRSKEKLEQLISKLGILYKTDKAPFKDYKTKMRLKAAPPEERIHNFSEVETGVEAHTAAVEAERCLRCFRLAMASF